MKKNSLTLCLCLCASISVLLCNLLPTSLAKAYSPTQGKLNTAAPEASLPPVKSTFDGLLVLECLGTTPGSKWLDGRTTNGTVGLAPGIGGSFSGTAWQVVRVRDNVVRLKCLGNVEGPRWLDGRTANGTVGLTGDPANSGTNWEIVSLPDNRFALKCLGTVDGPRWLDGRTGEGKVGLIKNYAETWATGAKWRARVCQPPTAQNNSKPQQSTDKKNQPVSGKIIISPNQ